MSLKASAPRSPETQPGLPRCEALPQLCSWVRGPHWAPWSFATGLMLRGSGCLSSADHRVDDHLAFTKFYLKQFLEAGKTAQQLRRLAALVEVLSSVLSTHVGATHGP